MVRPSGTVTFLFTDIEGSTRRWESDADAMRAALAAHDEVLRLAIAAHGGWLFKHTGDGVCAAFSSAPEAVAAAIDAQQELGLPVRMGLATGTAELRDADYFGPTLNRAARIMAAGHGGQILLAGSTAALVDGVELVHLGEHRLRDLLGPTRLFQAVAEGLLSEFRPLATLDAVPGNLPVQPTSFVGREVEVKEVVELVRTHRLVTLTGVGGVGKTRLAVQVAAEVVGEFPDGVWLVELATLRGPGAVPAVAATVLGVTSQAGFEVTESVVRALSGQRLLVVLDNCEHLLDAAADLVEALLARTSTVHVLATSREGLRVGAEQMWPVPSLDVSAGVDSAAVDLFVERARAVYPAFELDGPADADAVTEICRGLDGIALGIELAAARMVSMSPQDVRGRLGDRFRLLSGSRRGLERHQTLRHAVAWSHDLLEVDERRLLNRCSVFADGFDLAAAAHINGSFDEYTVLDLLDSLVRKSLVTAERVAGHARYGMLETIRQFAEEQLAATHALDEVRDRHAAYFAERTVAHCQIWDGPNQRVALDWVDVEFANLRAGFRRSSDRGDLVSAAVIAAHTALLGWALQRYEPVGWAEELLPAVKAADLAQLPRLCAAASLCSFAGRADMGVAYAQIAIDMEMDARYEPFPHGLSSYWQAIGYLIAGPAERALGVAAGLAAQPGHARVYGRCMQTQVLAMLGRREEAAAIAEDALTDARNHGNPFLVAHALWACGLACEGNDPTRALDLFHQGLRYARDHRVPHWEAAIARDAARLEAIRGNVGQALTRYEEAIGSLHRAGNVAELAVTLLSLASTLHRLEHLEGAATIYGAANQLSPAIFGALSGRLRTVLGDTPYERCVATGAAMEPGEAVHYAIEQIQLARGELGT